MRTLSTSALVFNVIAVLGCASIKVKSEYNKQIDFHRYKTYNWITQPKKPFAYLTTPVDPRWVTALIKQYVESELKAKGYRRADSNPDFLIAYYTNVKDKIDTAPLGYDHISDTYRGQRIEVREYREGSLVLDFVDGKTKEMIWRGLAIGVVKDAEKIEEQIEAAVEKILKLFPPNN